MKTMEDYKNLYLKYDVLLTFYVLSHYLSATGLSWDAMLKMIKIEPELIPHPDMYIFFKKGTRGREITYISKRY